MADAVELFRKARQKYGHLAISEEARANLRRWLEQKVEEGWTPEDEAEYLAAVAEDIKDSERLKATEEFWSSKQICITAKGKR